MRPELMQPPRRRLPIQLHNRARGTSGDNEIEDDDDARLGINRRASPRQRRLSPRGGRGGGRDDFHSQGRYRGNSNRGNNNGYSNYGGRGNNSSFGNGTRRYWRPNNSWATGGGGAGGGAGYYRYGLF